MHSVEAIKPGGVIGGAEEAHGVGGIADAGLLGFHGAEICEPAGVLGAWRKARRGVQIARAFPGHGVFVPPADQEHALGGGRKIHRHRHEGMIEIDNNPCAVRPRIGSKFFNAIEAQTALEHHVAQKRDVRGALLHRREITFGEAFKRFARYDTQSDPAFFPPACALAAEGVEFAVAGQHIDRAVSALGREQPHQQLVRIGSKGNGARIGQTQFRRDIGLRLRDDFAEDFFPFAVGQARGVFPGREVPLKGSVRPQMMRMGSEMQPPRRGCKRAREQALVGGWSFGRVHSLVLRDQSSGNARRVSVCCR